MTLEEFRKAFYSSLMEDFEALFGETKMDFEKVLNKKESKNDYYKNDNTERMFFTFAIGYFQGAKLYESGDLKVNTNLN